MTIRETIANTVRRKNGAAGLPDAQQAVAAYNDLKAESHALTNEGEALERKRQAKDRELTEAATARDDARFDALSAEHERILRAIEAHKRRRADMDKRLIEAHRTMQLTENSEILHAQEKALTERLEAAQAMQDAIAALAKDFRRYLEKSKSVQAIWPGIPPIGVLASQTELRRGLAVEYYRQHPTGAIAGIGTGLPGADSGVSLGPIDQIPSFVDKVAQANARLMAELAVALAPEKAAPQPADAQPVDEIDKLAASVQTQSAEQIMARMPAPQRVVIDTRKSREPVGE